MQLSRAEQETIVRWDRETETLTVFTHSSSAIRKLLAAGAVLKYRSAEGRAAGLEMPKEWFRWPKPKSKAKSEAARKRYQDRFLAQKTAQYIRKPD